MTRRCVCFPTSTERLPPHPWSSCSASDGEQPTERLDVDNVGPRGTLQAREKEGGSHAGPVEYIIVSFPGNKFNGEIAPELIALAESETIRILDLIFISKDALGNVVSIEIDDLDEALGFNRLPGEVGGLIGPEDIAFVADQLEPNSSAGVLIWEDLWAAPFARAILNSGGVFLQGARIPRELIDSAIDALPPAV